MSKVLGIIAALLLLLSVPAFAHDEKGGWVVCENCREVAYTDEELREIEEQQRAENESDPAEDEDEDEDEEKKK